MDSLVTMDAKLASKDLTVAWYDYKKAYDREPHTVVDTENGRSPEVAPKHRKEVQRWLGH